MTTPFPPASKTQVESFVQACAWGDLERMDALYKAAPTILNEIDTGFYDERNSDAEITAQIIAEKRGALRITQGLGGLHAAMKYSQMPVLVWLESKGADLNAQSKKPDFIDKSGFFRQSAISHGTQSGFLEGIKFLRAKGVPLWHDKTQPAANLFLDAIPNYDHIDHTALRQDFERQMHGQIATFDYLAHECGLHPDDAQSETPYIHLIASPFVPLPFFKNALSGVKLDINAERPQRENDTSPIKDIKIYKPRTLYDVNDPDKGQDDYKVDIASILSYGFKAGKHDRHATFNTTALIKCCYGGDIERASALVDHGAAPLARDSCGNNAFAALKAAIEDKIDNADHKSFLRMLQQRMVVPTGPSPSNPPRQPE